MIKLTKRQMIVLKTFTDHFEGNYSWADFLEVMERNYSDFDPDEFEFLNPETN